MLPTDAETNLFERATNLLQIIIENKKAEERIRITNERFLWATKATNEAIWDWDVKTNVLYWGEGFFQLFGYKSGYKVNTVDVWGDHIHPMMKSIERDRRFHAAKSPWWKDESVFVNRMVNMQLLPIRDILFTMKKHGEDGGTTEDITERNNWSENY